MAGAIAKPQLRGLSAKFCRNSVIGACLVSIVSGVLWKFLVVDARKQKYAEYYLNYDGEAKYKIMCDSGYMQACGSYKMSNRS